MQEGTITGRRFVVTCCDTSRILEVIEASLDAVAQCVELIVHTNGCAPVAPGRNHGPRASFGDGLADGVAVVAPVRDDGGGRGRVLVVGGPYRLDTSFQGMAVRNT